MQLSKMIHSITAGIVALSAVRNMRPSKARTAGYADRRSLGMRLGVQCVSQSAKTVAEAGISDYLRGWDEILGAHDAVGGDIVLCKCERHPRVVSVYARSCEYIDSWGASIASASPTPSTAQNIGYDQRFRLVNPRTGQPLRGTPYCIATEDGDELDGYTDSQGYTQPITGTQAISATLQVLEEVTPINPDWDKGL